MKNELSFGIDREFGNTHSLWHVSLQFNFWAGYRMCSEVDCEYTTKKKRDLKQHLASNCEDWSHYFDIFDWRYVDINTN